MNNEMENKTNKKKLVVFIITTIISVIYIIWRIFFTVPVSYGTFSLILGIVLVVCEAIGIFEEYEHFLSIYKKKH